jgi:D-inositol-3-phosphate glycosyltransferase
MNVYVDALASALARAGVDCDVYTRAEHPEQPDIVEVEPGFRVLHVDAGPREPVAKHDLLDLVDPFADAARELLLASPPVDVLHANYWLSGAVAHKLKHQLDLPLVATFHTLARVKADAGLDDDPELRARIEHEVVACADLMLASTDDEHATRVALRRRPRSHRSRRARRRPHDVRTG